MYESADFMYIMPPYRFTVYAIGILLGYGLQKWKHVKLSQLQLRLGWIAFIASLLITVTICAVNQHYSPFNDALFASIASITISLFFTFIIFIAHLGHGGK